MIFIYKINFIKFISLVILIFVLAFLSLILGYQEVNITDLINFFDNQPNANTVLETVRLPRTLAGILVGMGLGVSGFLLQVLTRNFIASPSIFGINSGAALAMIIVLIFFDNLSFQDSIYVILSGAFIAGALVFVIAGVFSQQVTALKLTLCGVSITILLGAIAQALLAQNQSSFEEVFFFLAGSLNFQTLDIISMVAPFIIIFTFIAFLFAKPISILDIDENIAKTLGQNTQRLKFILFILAVALAAFCVAISGPIALIGLISPHLARRLVSNNYYFLILTSSFIGAGLLLASDILARFLIYPKELPVGALSLILGATFFIYLARKA